MGFVRPPTPLRRVSAPPDEAVDPSNLDAIFRRFAPYVARIAGRVLGQWQEVDDVVQDVFLDAYRGLRGLRDPSAVRHWLATVTVRKARRRLARRRMMRWLGLDAPRDLNDVPDAVASADGRAQVLSIYRILDRVSPDARIAWVMHRVEDQPLEVVAEVCGCSRATAHRRVREAQAALEKGLNDD